MVTMKERKMSYTVQSRSRSLRAPMLAVLLFALAGCQSTKTVEVAAPLPGKDYTRALPPGVNPLRLVTDGARYRQLLEASY